MVMAGGDQQFCLRWNNHQTVLTSIFGELLDAEELFDCKIVAEGRSLRAHRILLSACSPYFKVLLSEHSEGTPIFILKDVKYKELCALMDYMYRGEVNISQDDLAELLKVAESLKIKGLSDTMDNTDERDVQKRAAAPQPQPSQPTVPKSGLTIQHRPKNDQSNDLQADLPSPKKRKRARRRTSADESGIGKIQAVDEHNGSNDPSIVVRPLPRALVTSTPMSKNTAVIPETQTTLAPNPPAIPVILHKTELPIAQILIPKLEIYDIANENNSEDLPMDDNDMDDSQPGPSHGSEGSSDQGYPPWQVGADGSVDEDAMRAQEAAGGSHDAQEFLFLEDLPIVVQHSSDEYSSDDEDYSSDDSHFHCPNCPKSFVGKRELIIHRKDDCGIEHRCPSCKKIFARKVTFKNHLSKGCEPFKCEKCKKRFVYERAFNRHKETGCFGFKLQSNGSQCSPSKVTNVVSVVNTSGGSLTKKESTIPEKKEGVAKCKCPSCKKIFLEKHALNIHLNNGCDTVLKCEKCKKIFVDEHVFNQHRESDCFKVKIDSDRNSAAEVTHTVGVVNAGDGASPAKKRSIVPDTQKCVKIIKCHSCKKIFKKNSYLRRHIKRGCSKAGFTCQMCSKVFRSLSAFSRHGETDCLAGLKCRGCKKTFKLRNALIVHLKQGCSALRKRKN